MGHLEQVRAREEQHRRQHADRAGEQRRADPVQRDRRGDKTEQDDDPYRVVARSPKRRGRHGHQQLQRVHGRRDR